MKTNLIRVRNWRVETAVLMTFALILGFTKPADAQTFTTMPLTINARDSETGTQTLPKAGGTIEVDIKYVNLKPSDTYTYIVQVVDLSDSSRLVGGNSGQLIPVKSNGIHQLHLRLRNGQLTGHKLAVVGSLLDSNDNIIAANRNVQNHSQRLDYGIETDSRDSKGNGPLSAPQPEVENAGSSTVWAWAIAAVIGIVGLVGAGLAFVASGLGKAFKFGR